MGSTKRRIVAITVVAVITIGSIELLLRLAARFGLVRINVYQTVERADQLRFLADSSPYFGVWHVPNAAVSVSTPVGDVTYETNSFGMRDRHRELKSDAVNRVVVLGDSFVEGYFVEESDRMTDLMEKESGIEHLNFGSGGDFGSIQEWLLYKHLVLQFDHSEVKLFLLPDNDFRDNDPAQNAKNRYRPYLQRSGSSFDVFYPIPFEQAGDRLRLSPWVRTKHTAYNTSYTLNLLVNFRPIVMLSGIRRSYFASTVTSAYDSYSEEDLARLLYSYEQILRLAGNRAVTVYVIPREKDFIAQETGRLSGRIVQDLAVLAGRHSNLRVVDLMPGFLTYMKTNGVSFRRFFLGFDPHWSPLGHRVAAQIVLAAGRDRAAAGNPATP